MSDSPHCARCGSLDVVPIIWGTPTPELIDAIDTGEVDAVIGGAITQDPSPTHECRECRSRFAEGEDWYAAPAPAVFFRVDLQDDSEPSDDEPVARSEQTRSKAEQRKT